MDPTCVPGRQETLKPDPLRQVLPITTWPLDSLAPPRCVLGVAHERGHVQEHVCELQPLQRAIGSCCEGRVALEARVAATMAPRAPRWQSRGCSLIPGARVKAFFWGGFGACQDRETRFRKGATANHLASFPAPPCSLQKKEVAYGGLCRLPADGMSIRFLFRAAFDAIPAC